MYPRVFLLVFALRTVFAEVAKDNNSYYNKNIPSFSTVKSEVYDTTSQTLQAAIQNHNDNHQKFLSNMTPLESEKIPAIVTNQKDNSNYIQKFPSIKTLKPAEIIYTTPKTLLDDTSEIIYPKDSRTEIKQNTNNSTQIVNESIENTNEKNKIEKSFEYISAAIGSIDRRKKNLLTKTYGMTLTGNHGYIWNALSKPENYYNVGKIETNKTKNPINIKGNTSEPLAIEKSTEIPNISNLTTSSEKINEANVSVTTENFMENATTVIRDENSTESYEKTTTELNFIVDSTTEANNKNEKNITPELDEFLKKYIKKLVKQEVTKQLGLIFTKPHLEINNGSGNNSGGHEGTKNDNNESTKDNEVSSKDQNNGNILGNHTVTNIFHIHLDNETIKFIGNDTTLLGTPVNKTLNDTSINFSQINNTVSNDEENKPDRETPNTLLKATETHVGTKPMELTEKTQKPRDDDRIEQYKAQTSTSTYSNV